MPDLYMFKAQVGMFEPTAMQNQNVAIHYVQNTHYRRVDYLEALPPFQCLNLGALAALTPSGRTNVPNLEMADNEFGLFRWYPIDDAQVRLYHPAGIAKAQLKWLQVPYDMNILVRDPNLVSTEIAVWEDNRPAMEAVNGHAFALGAVRIIAMGYRFHTIEIEPVSSEEKRVVSQLKNQYAGKKDADLIVEAIKLWLLPVTHVWCSGRGIGD